MLDQNDNEQMFVLDLSIKKNKKLNDDDMEMDDVKVKTNEITNELLPKFPYAANDMSMFWNMLVHFSFNNYNNLFNLHLKDIDPRTFKGRF